MYANALPLEGNTAKLTFRHALARVTLQLKRGADETGDGLLTKVRMQNAMKYDANNAEQGRGTDLCTTGWMSLRNGSINTEETKNAESYIEQTTEMGLSAEAQTIDFLVIPTALPGQTNTPDANTTGGGIEVLLTIDGKQYNVDVTYDDPSPDRLGKAEHTHFLVSDSKLSEDHSFAPDEGFGQCSDSFYDDKAIWENVSTAFVPIGKDFYYIKSGALYRWDGSESEYIDTIYATWFTDRGDQSYWRGNYSALLSYKDKLLYSKPDCIMSYDPANGRFEVFYKHSYGPDIYGFQIKDDQLLLQLSTSPNDEGIIQTAKLPY
jgi:hypothetical protein